MSKDFLKDVVDQFGEDIELGKDGKIPYWVDSGSYALNRIISGSYLKGYPGGKIVEIYGEPSTGKSYFIYTAIGNFQKQFGRDGIAVLDDTEDSFMPDFGAKLGMDVDRAIRVSSDTVEGHFKNVFMGAKGTKATEDEEATKAKPGVIPYILDKAPGTKVLLALDSVAALSTEHEKEVMFEKDDMTKAKKIKAGLRMNYKYVSDNEVLYLISNHVYQVIGSYVPTKEAPGGKGIKFMSTVRIDLSATEIRDNDRVTIGTNVSLKISKNKIAPPFGKTQIKVLFETGIDKMSGVSDLLLHDGLIARKQLGWLYLHDGKKVRDSELTEEILLGILDEKQGQVQEEVKK